LNSHPLNQAASRRLARLGNPGDNQQMSLLNLARQGLVEEDPDPAPDSPESRVLWVWGQHPSLQKVALNQLEDALSPQEVLSLPLAKVADRVTSCLLSLSQASASNDRLPDNES
jgi:hypothetical protein